MTLTIDPNLLFAGYVVGAVLTFLAAMRGSLMDVPPHIGEAFAFWVGGAISALLGVFWPVVWLGIALANLVAAIRD